MVTLQQQQSLRLFPLCMVGVYVAIAPIYAAEAPPAPATAQAGHLQSIQDLHRLIAEQCQAIWAGLSNLKSKEEADAYAPVFAESATKLAILDRTLEQLEQTTTLSPESKEFLQQASEQVIQLYVLVGKEFDGVIAANCLDSIELQRAFEAALREGFFYTTQSFDTQEPITYFTAEEEKNELERLQALLHPDQDALQCLYSVRDATSAKAAANELMTPIQSLHRLRPTPELLKRHFRPTSQNLYVRVSHPIEQALWGIRNEYIRIASNFSPNTTDFSSLANTLDELYLSLEETHHPIFAIVFDSSFLSDMDAAYEKHSTHTP